MVLSLNLIQFYTSVYQTAFGQLRLHAVVSHRISHRPSSDGVRCRAVIAYRYDFIFFFCSLFFARFSFFSFPSCHVGGDGDDDIGGVCSSGYCLPLHCICSAKHTNKCTDGTASCWFLLNFHHHLLLTSLCPARMHMSIRIRTLWIVCVCVSV